MYRTNTRKSTSVTSSSREVDTVSGVESTTSSARQRQSKRDEIIRKKAEAELSRKKTTPKRQPTRSRKNPGTVSALHHSAALTIRESMSIVEASQLMAAKRTDSVLVIDSDEHLCGIFTSVDLTYRIVALSQDARSIPVSTIMTKNPLCVTNDTSANDALNIMVHHNFRHLPICNDEGDVVALLDITKCLCEALDRMERAYGSSRKLYDALEGIEKEWSVQQAPMLRFMESLKDKMACPDLSVLLDGTNPPEVSPRTSVHDAAKLMKEQKTNAVLVMENGQLVGIFTTKDVVLRVIAAGLDPTKCSVVRVMTPHPDCASVDLTILEALRKMNDGNYTNLPVVNEAEQIIGLVDVRKLTHVTLKTLENIQSGDSESDAGPVWSKFFTAFDNDSESITSDARRSENQIPGTPEIYPHESASAVEEPTSSVHYSSYTNPQDDTFVFKFSTVDGKVHRIISEFNNFEKLRDIMYSKDHSLDPQNPLDICYVDDEGDIVVISNDSDLEHAVGMAKHHGLDRLKLSMGVEAMEQLHDEPQVDMRAQTPTPTPVPVPQEAAPTPAPEPKPKSSYGLPISDELFYGLAGGFAVATIMGLVMSRMK
ncbi:CBS-domain-containing protein [Basidiobolus meristosporus CBS 931.73]|uniref:CBS-domain-containing protein n=1 Tax=Basidiobolus meristosporus CBS 931.73 TaxID=1314790 RepID=A0A1Y1ZD80_9FUNG|nr:CBS-domain-containing protein [Basidiobolus meristosporus CBS 931.73]|eukprot:ORY08169.1 CBS-domain-containing protein [Basidiobolus meristosporus CBS 931.73]